MPTDKKNYAEQLPLPRTEPEAVEILRVWTTPDVTTTFVLRAFPFAAGAPSAPDPGIWGIVLADAVNQVTSAYEEHVRASRDEIIARIRETFDAALDGTIDRDHLTNRLNDSEPE